MIDRPADGSSRAGKTPFILAWGALGLALLAAIWMVQSMMAGDEDRSLERRLHGQISDRLTELVVRDGVNPVELSAIAGHPVDRICTTTAYSNVRSAAAVMGLDPAGLPDAGDSFQDPRRVPDGSYGLFLIAPSGRLTYGALPTTVFERSTAWCLTGARLAMHFAATAPLTDGVILDLDAPDLLPRAIPWQ